MLKADVMGIRSGAARLERHKSIGNPRATKRLRQAFPSWLDGKTNPGFVLRDSEPDRSSELHSSPRGT